MNRFILACSILILCSCNSDDDKTQDPVFCTLEARPGIEIIVKDAIDSSILVEGVEVVIIDGEYKETLTNFSEGDAFFGAYERTGTYSITVNKNKYKSNVTNSVTVKKDICHVITEKIEILLEKIQ